MAEKKQKPRKRAAPARGRGGAGRISVRRETAPYRAAAQEHASRVQQSIDEALAQGRRTREEIEARIDSLWNSPPRPPRKAAAPRRRRAARAKRH